MLTDYIQAAMRKAVYEILPDDHTYYGKIPGCRGVWANEKTLEECRKELQSALEDWILFRIASGLNVPVVEGLKLKFKRAA